MMSNNSQAKASATDAARLGSSSSSSSPLTASLLSPAATASARSGPPVTPTLVQQPGAVKGKRRMKKRVYVFLLLLVVLAFYSTFSEGTVGIIASLKGLGLLVFLWVSVWFLFLRNVPTIRTLVSVIFQVTEDAEKRPKAKRKVVVYE